MRLGPSATFLIGEARRRAPVRARKRGPFTGHAGGVGLMLLLALWLMRRFLFTSAFPAGTDMLGFISRAKENSSWGDIFSLWSPSSFGAPRQFTLDFSFQYIDQDQVRIGTHKGFVGEIPSTHDEIRTVNRGIGFLANYATSALERTP